MSRLTVFVACLSLVLASFRPCDQPTTFLPMLMNASPDTVRYGTNMTFFVYFTHYGKPVAQGSLQIVTTTHGVTVYNQTFPMCDYIQCPVNAGNTTWIRTFDWPTSFVGKYTTHIVLKNATTEFLCLAHQIVVPWF